MQEWMQEEWYILGCGQEWNKDEDIQYQLQQRREYLLQLCIRWESMVQGIPCSLTDSWGPTSQDLMVFWRYEFSSQTVDEDIGVYEVDEDEGFEDADFLDTLEETALLDHYSITKKHLCDRVTQVTDTRSKLPKHTQV